MSDEQHSMSVASARRLGATLLQDDAGESRRMATLLNDAFSKLGMFGRCSAYPTAKAESVVIQFHREGTYAMVEVNAVRFAAYCREHCTPRAIMAALHKKYDLSTTTK